MSSPTAPTTSHVTQRIERPAEVVAAYIRDPQQLPTWAAGLASGIRRDGDRWFSDSPMGTVEVAFVPDNPYGVCDHDVTLPDGTVVTNPVRVIADGAACDVVFTLRPVPGITVEAFEHDLSLITGDLHTLRLLLEARPRG
jgi:hypothetical protein